MYAAARRIGASFFCFLGSFIAQQIVKLTSFDVFVNHSPPLRIAIAAKEPLFLIVTRSSSAIDLMAEAGRQAAGPSREDGLHALERIIESANDLHEQMSKALEQLEDEVEEGDVGSFLETQAWNAKESYAAQLATWRGLLEPHVRCMHRSGEGGVG